MRQNLTLENQKLLEEWQNTNTQLANLIYNRPENLPLEQYRQQVGALKAEAEKLESELARRSAEFRVETQPVEIEAIQPLIPENAALVEMIRYEPFDPKAKRGERWGEPRYAAYILKSQGEPEWVDLGEAAAIESIYLRPHLKKRAAALPGSAEKFKAQARQLDELLMRPIRQKLGNKTHLLLSPDGKLNLIPFEALVDENGQYLIENYTFTYLTTGRDLLKLQVNAPSQQPPMIIADPIFDQEGKPTNVVAQASAQTRSTRGGSLSRDVISGFKRLPGTAAEAAAITPLFPQASVLTQAEATENAVKAVKAPQILHIATHGFFLSDLEQVAPRTPELGSMDGLTARTPATPQQENPLLRSGLALAGYNLRKSGSEDGVLTALEVASLNLRGTELVVLSACETGVGEVANGEGVYGLRRAFVIAGARSSVFSLWYVDDAATKDLMVQYYQRLQQGMGRTEALRQTQLEMLRSPEYQHPYYWAAFLPSGDWTPLKN